MQNQKKCMGTMMTATMKMHRAAIETIANTTVMSLPAPVSVFVLARTYQCRFVTMEEIVGVVWI
jgi:hypothetical protein